MSASPNSYPTKRRFFFAFSDAFVSETWERAQSAECENERETPETKDFVFLSSPQPVALAVLAKPLCRMTTAITQFSRQNDVDSRALLVIVLVLESNGLL